MKSSAIRPRCGIAAVFMLATLALAACGVAPEAPVSLSSPGEAAYDERLVGMWYTVAAGSFATDSTEGGIPWPSKWETAGGAYFVHIRATKDQAVLQATGIYLDAPGTLLSPSERPEDPHVPWVLATAFASEVGDETYYNVKRFAGVGWDYTAAGEQPGFIIARVRFLAEDQFLLEFLSPDVSYVNGDSGEKLFAEYGVEIRLVGEGPKYLWLEVTREQLRGLIDKVKGDERLWKGARWFKLPLPGAN